MDEKEWVTQEQLDDIDGEKFLNGLDELVDRANENFEEQLYPFGQCQCGGAYDQRGFCVDKCARESYYRG